MHAVGVYGWGRAVAKCATVLMLVMATGCAEVSDETSIIASESSEDTTQPEGESTTSEKTSSVESESSEDKTQPEGESTTVEDCDPYGAPTGQLFEFDQNIDESLPEEWRIEFNKAMGQLQALAPISDCVFNLPKKSMSSPLSVYAWSSDVSNPWPEERPGLSGACICGDGSGRWMALEINADEFKFDSLHRYAVIAHEYFHVFQIARSGDQMMPVWLVEGGAKTFEELFTQTYYGASEFDNGLFPVTARGLDDPSVFEQYVNVEGDRNYNFSSFMVLALINELVESQGLSETEALKLVLSDYWGNLQGRSSWEDVFSETFGISSKDFYVVLQDFQTEESKESWYSGEVVSSEDVSKVMPDPELELKDIFS